MATTDGEGGKVRVLVIGGTGFVGPHVVRRLVDAGHEVTVFHRGETVADLPASVVHLHGHRARLAEFAAEIRRVDPETVLDMHAMSEADARAVVAAVAGVAKRLVAISSMDVYRAYGRLHGTEPGPPEPVPFGEEAPLRERLFPYRDDAPWPADDSRQALAHNYEKILVERTVMGEPRLAGTILRLPFVYGPGDGQHRLRPYVRRIDDGRPAILLGEAAAGWRGTRGYVANVAAAIALAVGDDRAAGRVYNVGEEDAPTEAAFARAVGRAAGWAGEVVVLPDDRLPAHLASPVDFAQPMVVDTGRLRRELAYAEPIPRDEWLRATVAWERANPPPTDDLPAFDYAAEDAALASHRSTDER